MITIRQIERLFQEQRWHRLWDELLANRPEAQFVRLCEQQSDSLRRVVPIAALAMIRLDELAQSHHTFYRRLLNIVLTGQQKDGGWGDPLTTALCLRALLTSNGEGCAVGGALAYLANLQKTEGIWPREPLRRMPADATVSAFILHQLGEFELFRHSVRFDDAIGWFIAHEKRIDDLTWRLWTHAKSRCRLQNGRGVPHATLWTTRPAA